MRVLINAMKKDNIAYDNGATVINSSYSFGDGDYDINISGTGTNVEVGNGNSTITHYGDNATIKTGNGNQTITSLGDNKTIVTGDTGDDEVLFIGNNIDLKTNGGNDNLVFYGNNCNISMGDGDDSVTTYDQVYTEKKYEGLTNAFLDSLRTGTWSTSTLRTSELIDYSDQRKRWGKRRQTWVYERHYTIKEYFSQYIDGTENTKIDMGTGSDNVNVTKGTGTTISVNKADGKTDNVQINDTWQIDTLTDEYDKVKIETETKTSRSWKRFTKDVCGYVLKVVAVGCWMCPPIAAGIWYGGNKLNQQAKSGSKYYTQQVDSAQSVRITEEE